MKTVYSVATAVFRKLPLPGFVRDKVRSAAFLVVPSLKPEPAVQEQPEPTVPVLPQVPVLDRKSKLLSHIYPLSQDGLEIGALCWPIIKKDESNGRVKYVDFSTAEKSREKYKDDPAVNVDEIVETDYLWGKQTLPELVDGRLFDYVVASHVIEHVPNMLGWLREIGDILKDDGVLSLAIPDKRFTFDYKRDLTSFGTLVESYLLDRRRPSSRDIFDQVALATKVDIFLAWSGAIDPDKLEHHGTLQDAFKLAQEYVLCDDCHDVHVNIFTPTSFLAILEKASQIGLFDFTVLDFYDTAYNSLEFIVSLRRLPRGRRQEDKFGMQLDSIAMARQGLDG